MHLEAMAPFLTNDISTTGGGPTQTAPVINGMESSAQPNNSAQVDDHVVDTEFLIVGAGPAGASLACFLGSYGMFCMIRGLLCD